MSYGERNAITHMYSIQGSLSFPGRVSVLMIFDYLLLAVGKMCPYINEYGLYYDIDFYEYAASVLLVRP